MLPASFTAPPPDHPVVRAEIGGRLCRLLLPIGQVIELERLTGRGVQEIIQRFALQQASSTEIAETLRFALVGGGECSRAEADAVTEVYIRPRLFDFVKIACDVLLAAVSGIRPDNEVPSGEVEPGEEMGLSENPVTPGPSIVSGEG